jgi:hypothetical protein
VLAASIELKKSGNIFAFFCIIIAFTVIFCTIIAFMEFYSIFAALINLWFLQFLQLFYGKFLQYTVNFFTVYCNLQPSVNFSTFIAVKIYRGKP